MPTRSMPTVSCLSMACAIDSLVPTPSVLLASRGSLYLWMSDRNSPATPPSPPTTSGRLARAMRPFISSTARSPASMSTPASAYDDFLVSVISEPPRRSERSEQRRGVSSRALEGVGGATRGQQRVEVVDAVTAVVHDLHALGMRVVDDVLGSLSSARVAGQALEHVLADEVGLRDLDRVVAGEAGAAELAGRLVARGRQ